MSAFINAIWHRTSQVLMVIAIEHRQYLLTTFAGHGSIWIQVLQIVPQALRREVQLRA